jgi:hypothetical protein
MPMDSAVLLVHCQIALGLTQKELGDLLGMASALQPVRPDLAEQVLELGRTMGIVGQPASPATAEVIDAILQAAADAGGTSPEAIRPAVTAALLKAEERGLPRGRPRRLVLATPLCRDRPVRPRAP